MQPTGTIGLVMDCGHSTGIEPDFALVKFKKLLLAGGHFKIISTAPCSGIAHVLGYSESQIAEIIAYAVGHGFRLGQALADRTSTAR